MLTTHSFLKKGSFHRLVISVNSLCSFGQFFTIIFGFYWRLSHEGRVCCGDFVEDGSSTEGYLVTMGFAWKGLLVFYLLAIVGFLCYILMYLETHVKKSEVEYN